MHTLAFSLISIIMSYIKHRHMDAYAFIIFSQLHIIDFAIDIHVYDTYDIIPYKIHTKPNEEIRDFYHHSFTHPDRIYSNMYSNFLSFEGCSLL